MQNTPRSASWHGIIHPFITSQRRLLPALLLWLLVPLYALASTPGSLDTSFNTGTGFNGTVYASATQPDGKVLVAGNFTSFNGTTRNRIARLNADGSLDNTFNPGTGADAYIYSLALQTDGKIVIGGTFTLVQGVMQNFFARLNADGTLDSSFNPGTGPNAFIQTLVLQADGKILAAGSFTSVNGIARNRIARFNADGTLDNTFDPGTGPNNAVVAITLQADGKIVIGGSFTSVNGNTRNRIARLNTNGSVDTTFNPSSGPNSTVSALTIQTDGKIIIGGSFTSVSSTARNRIARLNASGTLDTSFTPGTGANSTVTKLALQPDGKLIISGDFTTINGVARNRIARLNANGSLDTDLDPGTGPNDFRYTMHLQADGTLIIGGQFTAYNGVTANRIAKLHTGDTDGDGTEDGADGFSNNAAAGRDADKDGLADNWAQPNPYDCLPVDTTCNGLTLDTLLDLDNDSADDRSADNCPYVSNADQADIDSDGTGNACDLDIDNDGLNNTTDNCPLMVNVDQQDTDADAIGDVCDPAPMIATAGRRDIAFNIGTGFNGTVYSTISQPDGKILAAGDFTTINGITRNRIARLNADGSLDNTFDPGASANAYIYSLALQADGKIVVGGGFTQFNGSAANYITRLNTDGSLDSSFAAAVSTNGAVRSAIMLRNGQIMIGGAFTTVNNTPYDRLARLNADGSLDTTFSNAHINNTVWAIAEQFDGNVVVGGDFTHVNALTRNRITRFTMDGTEDANFVMPFPRVNATVFALAIQSDNKIILGGLFTSVSGTAINRIARLHTDGSLDTGFNPGTGFNANSMVAALQLQPDGKILAGGSFTNASNVIRPGIARLHANGAVDTTFDPGAGVTGVATPYVFSIAVQANGKLVLGGDFTQYNNTSTPYLVRISSDDTDADGIGDATDAFVNNTAAAADADADGLPDAWLQPNPYSCAPNDTSCNGLTLDTLIDSDDRDNIANASDNCLYTYNPDQADIDNDNIGDTCDLDKDNDGVNNNSDNCLVTANSNQQDSDDDGVGDVCDATPTLAPTASRDVSFNTSTSINSTVYATAVQPDGKVLVGGHFTNIQGTVRNRIARLNADGTLDTSFDPGIGADSIVRAFAVQPDGKIIMVGDFYTVNGIAHNNIARLNTDGSLDTNFNPVIAGYYITTAVLQPDGKIVIGGAFTTVNSIERHNIARLNADGTLDTNFDPDFGTDEDVRSIALQLDGKIVIGGSFISVNGATHNRIARLNTNGSVDTTFNPSSGPDSTVSALTIQTDGKIIIGGDFTSVSGTARNRIARLNADGTLDIGFNPGTGIAGGAAALALQPDGKIILGGGFTTVNGVARNRIARLNADGTLDVGFDPGISANTDINSITVQTNGRLLVGGVFTLFNNIPINYLTRIHTGDTDADNIEDAADAFVNNPAAAVDADTDNLADAWLQPNPYSCAPNDTHCNGLTRDALVDAIDKDNVDNSNDNCPYLHNPDQANADADSLGDACDLDADNDGLGNTLDNCPLTSNSNQQDIDADGVGDVCDPTPAVAPIGSRDMSFNIGTGFDSTVYASTVLPDGRVLVAGNFTNFNGTARNDIARLHADGTLDTGFNPGTGTSGSILALAAQADGKVIIGGHFTTVNGMARNRIARLNTDGTLDTSFDPGTAANDTVYALALQLDGKVILGGYFTTINGTARNRIARLNSDGSLDTSFNPGAGLDGGVRALALQPDGKIILGGEYYLINGTGHGGIDRLNTDGSLDSGFAAGYSSIVQGTVTALALQPDGKIVLSGNFSSIYGVPHDKIGRLHANGLLDTSFNTGSGIANNVFNDTFALQVQADGKIILGGDFSSVNGVARSYIARFYADGALDISFNPGEDAPVHTLAVRTNGRLIVGGASARMGAVIPAVPLTSIHTGDVDADGIEDGADNDSDNDGTANAQDAFPFDPSEQLDTDSDSIGNNADLDDDGDSVPDYIDAEPLNASNANEATLPLNGNYKGSVIRDNAAVE